MLNQSAGVVTSVVSAIHAPIMTSREVTVLIATPHPNFKRDIEVMLLQLHEDASKLANIYYDRTNPQHIEYHRDYIHTESSYMSSQPRHTTKGIQWIGGLGTAHKAAGGAE